MKSIIRSTKKAERSISAPFDDFFHCYPLVAIFHIRGILPPQLASIQQDLQFVCDELKTNRERAEAALRIAQYATKHFAAPASGGWAGVTAEKWLKLADEKFHSPRGALEHATAILTRHELTIREPGTDFTPSLESKDQKKDGALFVRSDVSDCWLNGVRHALNASVDSFGDWSKDDLLATISCLVNIFSLPRSEFGTRATLLERLSWMLPIWDMLLEKIATHDNVGFVNPYENSRYLRMQKRAILLDLKNRQKLAKQDALNAQKIDDDDFTEALENAIDSAMRAGADEEITLIRSKIPTSVDREERMLLVKYEALRGPIRLARLPPRERLQEIKLALLDEFPWAPFVIDAALEDLFARSSHGSTRMSAAPLLLVGLPGVGKTRFAHRLATHLNIPSAVVNMAGMTDAKVLKGTSRGWSTGRPSRIVELMLMDEYANPIVILDEVDKAQNNSDNNGGVPQDALLDLLEPGNAKRYSDSFLMTEIDLSHAMYILTSNSLLRLSAPLLSRLKIVFFPQPGPEHTGAILRGLVRDLETQWGVPAGTIDLSQNEKNELKGLSPRQIRERILMILGGSTAMSRHVLH